MRPNFYRAATDNDLGVRQTGKYPDSRMWAKAEPQLTGFALTPGDSEVKAVADYAIPAVGARLRLTYTVAPDGSVRISETMTADPARKDVADLMRFGMAFETPGMFDAVEYYGRGPMENYADRSGAAFVGRYAQRVADQFHMKYVSPQESGTRSGLCPPPGRPRARRPHARQYRERPVRTGLRQQLGTAPPPRIPAALRRLLIQLPAAARHRRTVADGQPTQKPQPKKVAAFAFTYNGQVPKHELRDLPIHRRYYFYLFV